METNKGMFSITIPKIKVKDQTVREITKVILEPNQDVSKPQFYFEDW